MLSKVSILCFAASYGVALVLEITRLFFRSSIRGVAMLGFTAAGLVAHTAFLFYQGQQFNQQMPLSSDQHWYLAAAWVLAALYLFLTYHYPHIQFGLFFLPLILALIAIGWFVADPHPASREPVSRIWGVIHGMSVLLATVSVLLGFAAGLMYLRQARRLKRKILSSKGLRLPSLEWLQRANSHTIALALLMLGIGLVSGAILNLTGHPGEEFVPWTDPVILSTLMMFMWLLVSSCIGPFYKPARQGRKVAYRTIVSFIFLVIALAIGLFVPTQHLGGRRDQAQSTASQPHQAIQPHQASQPHQER